MASDVSQIAQIKYPESDGKPMGETGIHATCTLELFGTLTYHFQRRRDVNVSNNLFLYYKEGDPKQVVCPDVFVAFNVAEGQRRTWKVWEEGKGPDVVFEISSESTRLEDLGNKRVLYAELGVAEYYLFDPLGEWLDPPLRGYRLDKCDYTLMEATPLASDLLGLELRPQNTRLRLFDPVASKLLPAPWDEVAARQEAEEELAKARKEIERLRRELRQRTKE